MSSELEAELNTNTQQQTHLCILLSGVQLMSVQLAYWLFGANKHKQSCGQIVNGTRIKFTSLSV